jgi:hypothetical protein
VLRVLRRREARNRSAVALAGVACPPLRELIATVECVRSPTYGITWLSFPRCAAGWRTARRCRYRS